MRPAYYHEHPDNKTYPGDSDVHGTHPRPRVHEFDREPGVEMTAYVDPVVEATLADPNSLYTNLFGELARERVSIDFKFVDRSHWLYEAVGFDEYLLWWRRRRQFSQDIAVFPWYPVSWRDEFTLFDRNSMLPVVRVQVRSYDQDRGRSATGWASVRFVTPIERVPGIMAEMSRINLDDVGVEWW